MSGWYEQRRDAVTVGVVLASLLVAASLLPLRAIPAPPKPPAAAPDPVVPATAAPSPSTSPNGLFPPAPALPTFPLTASWEPAWRLGRGFGYYPGPGSAFMRILSYSTADESKVMTLSVEESEPSQPRSSDTSIISVLGRPATVYRFNPPSGPRSFSVTWTESTRWFRLFASGVGEDEVLSFVDGLRDNEQPMRTAVVCPVLPAGMLVSTVASAFVYYYAPNLGGWLTVTFMAPTAAGTAGAVPVQVGSRRGELLPEPFPDRAAATVRVFDDAWRGRALYVIADDVVGLTSDQLIAFAATVEVDQAALVRG